MLLEIGWRRLIDLFLSLVVLKKYSWHLRVVLYK